MIPTLRGIPLLFAVVSLFAPALTHAAAPPVDTAAALTTSIDKLLADHWREQNVTPAAMADDAASLRRATIDLAGRVPTLAELDALVADRSPHRYATAVRRLIGGPEFSAHFATVLDELIQGKAAGNADFVGYLRRALRAGKGWDVVFREVLVGPWTDDDRKPARLFLERRARDLDVMTVDVTRAFFGVDVSCARCHDHPLVEDWTQQHYYGMGAFFVRTTGGKGNVGEKFDGEAKFAGKDGKEQQVPMMFLSSRTFQDPPNAKAKRFSRREELVRVGLAERHFFSRAFVNRTWEYLLGRGLVDPSDQMHSANPASIPALLEHLADDFASHGYDVRRLVTAIVLSRAYRLDSRWTSDRPQPEAGHFAVARLRPLSPRQYSRSLVVAVGDGSFTPTAERLAELDKVAATLAADIDPPSKDFQSSTREALYVSNSEAMQKLIGARGHLADRLARMRDDGDLVRLAYRTILGRPPRDAELKSMVGWLAARKDRQADCEDLVWALASSAEFRFNH